MTQKVSRKNEKKKSITVNVDGKWCDQDKNNNNQNPSVQKKYAYDDITNKYLQQIDDQRKKLKILHKYDIKNYKTFRKE